MLNPIVPLVKFCNMQADDNVYHYNNDANDYYYNDDNNDHDDNDDIVPGVDGGRSC